MTFRELYAINVYWSSETLISVAPGLNPQNERMPRGVKRLIRGEAGSLLKIFGDARVEAFGCCIVVLAYEDYIRWFMLK